MAPGNQKKKKGTRDERFRDIAQNRRARFEYEIIDTVDAGVGDLVLTCSGSSARQTAVTKDTPVDAVIMSVIDSLEVDGEIVFRKS